MDLDRESKSMYTLVVIAEDQADNENDRQTSTATVSMITKKTRFFYTGE